MKRIFILLIIMGFCMSVSGFELNVYRVAGNNVNLREKPSLNSKVVGQLPAGMTVRLKKKDEKKVKIGDMEGNWAYVEADIINPDTNEPYEGWIYDYFLWKIGKRVGTDGFEKVVKIELKQNDIEATWLGDGTKDYYHIYENGSFKATIDGEVVRGHMYKYKSLYVLQADNVKLQFYIDNLQLTPTLSVDRRCKPEYLKLKKMPEVVPCE